MNHSIELHARRKEIIEQIARVPEERLNDLARMLDLWECGDSPPLLVPGTVPVKGSQGGSPLSHGKDWPHAPLHRISTHGTFIVTAGTLDKQHWFAGSEKLDLLESALLRVAKQFGWQLEAWAVFSNHYHFVGHSHEGSADLEEFTKQLHGETARAVNQLDQSPGRCVWHNYWDTQLTFEKSYLARLSYVHQNPVKHRLVPLACRYRWCSAAWFERTATRAQVKTVYRFKTDRLKVQDEFAPI